MYSDTHFHFQTMIGDDYEKGSDFFMEADSYNPFFMMDIGTRCDDLLPRLECVEKCVSLLDDGQIQSDVKKFMYFSAGIWPDPEEIRDRKKCMEMLEKQIADFQSRHVKNQDGGFHGLAAIGECGLDHHWNSSERDGDFDKDLLEGERELFIMQMELARRLNLPLIVHTRDAFCDTLSCMDEAGFSHGIIHCFSYGRDEAKAFLDRGWYIALGGAVTYTKKKNMDAMRDLISYIPSDRLLLETDAPYLAPVPMRGHPNTPLYIKHTYEFISEIRGVSVESLSCTVDENCRSLFECR